MRLEIEVSKEEHMALIAHGYKLNQCHIGLVNYSNARYHICKRCSFLWQLEVFPKDGDGEYKQEAIVINSDLNYVLGFAECHRRFNLPSHEMSRDEYTVFKGKMKKAKQDFVDAKAYEELQKATRKATFDFNDAMSRWI